MNENHIPPSSEDVLFHADAILELRRKPYHPPRVTVYGDLTELTRQDLDLPLGKSAGLAGPMGGSWGAP